MDRNGLSDLAYIKAQICEIKEISDKISSYMAAISDGMDETLPGNQILTCACNMLSDLCIEHERGVRDLYASIPNFSSDQWKSIQEKFDKILEEIN